jgi:2'-5' RNA ligase
VLTALVIPFPESASVTDEWRERTCADRPSIGIPAHVTLLFPFVPAEEIDDEALAELRALFAATPAFAVAFRELHRWPGMGYLAPDPSEPFIRLTEAVVAHWPEHQPYGGAHAAIVPHLTVAYGDDALLAEVEADVRSQLPIQAMATSALLLEELERDWRRWGERARFPLRIGDG